MRICTSTGMPGASAKSRAWPGAAGSGAGPWGADITLEAAVTMCRARGRSASSLMTAKLPRPLRDLGRIFEVEIIVFNDGQVGLMALALDAHEVRLYLLRREHAPHPGNEPGQFAREFGMPGGGPGEVQQLLGDRIIEGRLEAVPRLDGLGGLAIVQPRYGANSAPSCSCPNPKPTPIRITMTAHMVLYALKTKPKITGSGEWSPCCRVEPHLSRTRFPWTHNWLNRSVQGGPEHDR